MKWSPQTMKGKPVTLDEEIVIPNWNTSKLSVEKMRTLGDLLDRKAKQEEMRKEHQQDRYYIISKIYFLIILM